MSDTAITTTIRRHLDDGRNDQFRTLIRALHPSTRAQALSALSLDELTGAFRTLRPRGRADVIMHFDDETRRLIIEQLNSAELAPMLEHMHHDERVDLLQEMPGDKADEAMRDVSREEREDIERLSKYQEGTVGAVATTEYVELSPDMTASEAVASMRDQALDQETIYYGYVTTQNRELVGVLSLKELIMAPADTLVRDIMQQDVIAVYADDDDLVASRKLQKYDFVALPVLDERGIEMLGIITFDDVLDVIEEDTSETMYQKAGIGSLMPSESQDEIYSRRLTQGPIGYPVKVRMLFLLVTLAGGLMVGGVIDHFEDTLEAILAAAIFIPLIMDMGGNVGTQSTTIFARGFALGHIRVEEIWQNIRREMSVGLVLGAILGVAGGLVAFFWQGAPNDIPELGLAVGLSLMLVVPLATFLGYFLPYVLLKAGFDHAPGADPFITTIKDFVSLAFYFTLINLLIGVA